MDKFKESLIYYCEDVVDFNCGKCAFSAPCHIANEDESPREMDNRDLQIMLEAALKVVEEIQNLIKDSLEE